MQVLQSLRRSRSRLARVAFWLGLAAAFSIFFNGSVRSAASFALAPPPGYILICSAGGARFIRAEPGQPDTPAGHHHTAGCGDCCLPLAAVLPGPIAPTAPALAGIVAILPLVQIAAPTLAPRRKRARDPPRA
jgi:hypothetical protein